MRRYSPWVETLTVGQCNEMTGLADTRAQRAIRCVEAFGGARGRDMVEAGST